MPFFENVNKNIEDFIANKEHRIIIGRYFNVTLDSDLDCSGRKPFKKSLSNKYKTYVSILI